MDNQQEQLNQEILQKNNKKKINNKCKGISCSGKQCNHNVQDELFCKDHKYMESYTDKMMSNLTLCTGCRRRYYLENGKQCDDCKERGRLNRLKQNENIKKCKVDECENNSNNEVKYTEYCGKHQLYGFRDEVKELNKFTCYNDVRGCRSIMDVREYSKCDVCREKERMNNKKVVNNDDDKISDKEIVKVANKKVIKKKNSNEGLSLANQLYNQQAEKYAKEQKDKLIINNDLLKQIDDEQIDDSDDDINDDIEEIKQDDVKEVKQDNVKDNVIKPHRLTGCQGYLYNRQQCPIKLVLDNGYCRNHQRFASLNITKEELDDIRNGTEYTNIRFSKASGNNGQWVRIEGEFKTSLKQRLQKRIIDKKRRMEGCSKDIWNKNNPEKIAKYDLDNKARRIETEGDGYWIKNAEQAKRWRENNPEKVKIINEQRCYDPLLRLYSMKRQAYLKGRIWEISDEEAIDLINDDCYYCGGKNESSCNSIDRLDSDLDYTLENCATSCTMCNYMKNTLKLDNFLKIIEHICAYNKLNVNAKLNNSISNYVSSDYNKYIVSAKKRDYEFQLLEDEFYEIILNPCYICGKMNKYDKNNKLVHRNGIDRFDNTIGYVKDNCRSCCSTCNYLKRDISYDNFIQKIKQIYGYRCKTYNYEKAYEDKIEELDRIWGNDELSDEYMNELNDEYMNEVNNDSNNDAPKMDKKIIKQISIDEKRERVRLQKQLYRQKKRDEMGDEEYKKKCAEEKFKQRNNGLIKENKHKKTPEEIKEEKRKRIALQRQQLREKYGDEEYRKMMAQERAKNRAKNNI
jgi:hypothetical protein